MCNPSGRVLDQTVDYYPAVISKDAVGAPQYTYPFATARDVPCSAQPGVIDEIEDQGRIIQERQWKLLFAQPIPGMARGMFLHTDRAGATHTLFAHVGRDEAGRGRMFVVRCVERV